jgi:hypothetical protein
MRSLAYTRFELLRTFRNRRMLAFSLGFPLILFFVIAAPNRHQHNFNGSGISIPLYYMVGLVAFGAMTALLSSGARIAIDRTDGWTRQLRITPLKTNAYFAAKIATGYAAAAVTIAVLYASGVSLGVSLGAGRWLEMTGLIHLVPARIARVPARHRPVPPVLLAGPCQPRVARRSAVVGRRVDRRRRLDLPARDSGPLRLPARHRASVTDKPYTRKETNDSRHTRGGRRQALAGRPCEVDSRVSRSELLGPDESQGSIRPPQRVA